MPAYEDFARLETDGWADDAMAAGYVDLFAPASDMAVPAVVARLAPGMRVLDLCCGQGNLSAGARDAGCEVTGLDFSPAMLAHARRTVPGVEFVEGDAQALPFFDEGFDAVTCGFGLMHVPDQPKALAEVARVLKPNGLFSMTSWHGPDVSPVFAVLYGNVRAHGSPEVSLPDSPDFHRFAVESSARELFDGAGLTLEEMETVPCHWDLGDPADLAEIFRTGTPRAGHLLTRQPEANLRAIKAGIAQSVRERFANGEGWRAPFPAMLAVARRR